MIIQKRKDLQQLSTFGLKAHAEYMIEFDSDRDLFDISEFIEDLQLPSITLGGGSNLIFCANYPGVIIKNIVHSVERQSKQKITVSAGYDWDEFVQWTIEKNLSGIELLSGIPGTVGGAVSLNAGAYGACVKDSLESIRVYDIYERRLHSITAPQLNYGHRTSLLRQKRGNDWVILDATFILHSTISPPRHPKILELREVERSTPSNLRRSVLGLRSHMPNPFFQKNSGSFFLNPTVPNSTAHDLRSRFPDIMMRPYDGKHEQIAAGWLLEQSGFKGKRISNFIFHENHANLVINDAANTSGRELIEFIKIVQETVEKKFGIHIVPEPLLVGEEYWQGLLSTPTIKNIII